MKFFWIFELIDLEKKKRKKIIDSNVKKIKKNLKKKKNKLSLPCVIHWSVKKNGRMKRNILWLCVDLGC